MHPDGDSWVYRPAVEGLIRAESLYDGTISLAQVARLNDELDIREDNRTLAQEAMKR